MPRRSPRETELENTLLQIAGDIDNCDQSRTSLSETMDTIRETVAEAYGDAFEDDLREFLGLDEEEDLADDDEGTGDDEEEEDEDDGVNA